MTGFHPNGVALHEKLRQLAIEAGEHSLTIGDGLLKAARKPCSTRYASWSWSCIPHPQRGRSLHVTLDSSLDLAQEPSHL